jgi:hypothetical protein
VEILENDETIVIALALAESGVDLITCQVLAAVDALERLMEVMQGHPSIAVPVHVRERIVQVCEPALQDLFDASHRRPPRHRGRRRCARCVPASSVQMTGALGFLT